MKNEINNREICTVGNAAGNSNNFKIFKVATPKSNHEPRYQKYLGNALTSQRAKGINIKV